MSEEVSEKTASPADAGDGSVRGRLPFLWEEGVLRW